MWQFIRSGGVAVVVVVAVWRGMAGLIERSRELAASGELARRLDARRRELVIVNIARAHASEGVRVPVAGAAGCGHVVDGRTLASVHVGSVRDVDIDDVGLLEGAMRRAANERMDVSATGVRRRAVKRARRAAHQGERHVAAVVIAATQETASAQAATPRPPRLDGGWTDWRWLAGDADVDAGIDEERAATWELPVVVLGAALTLVPLVRPLAAPAPWLALAGLALVLAGWLGARRA